MANSNPQTELDADDDVAPGDSASNLSGAASTSTMYVQQRAEAQARIDYVQQRAEFEMTLADIEAEEEAERLLIEQERQRVEREVAAAERLAERQRRRRKAEISLRTLQEMEGIRLQSGVPGSTVSRVSGRDT